MPDLSVPVRYLFLAAIVPLAHLEAQDPGIPSIP
jgi:hypothetical protein